MKSPLDPRVEAAIARGQKQQTEAFPVATLDDLSDAAAAVIKERLRQVYGEGWTPEHDDKHSRGEMARAAACYAIAASYRDGDEDITDSLWPWASEWWKSTTNRRDLVKAGALIITEIERLDRSAFAAAKREESDAKTGQGLLP